MTITQTTIPRPLSEYQKEPFDPDLTFKINGVTTRHMLTPLDETYVYEPRDRFVIGAIPPEEREVRDHMVVVGILRSRVMGLDVFFSKVFGEIGETPEIRALREATEKLDALASKSREHRAAFLRMAHGKEFSEESRSRIVDIVKRADLANLSQGTTC